MRAHCNPLDESTTYTLYSAGEGKNENGKLLLNSS